MAIVRVVQAAIGETIEIHWWRRTPDPGSSDPLKKDLTEILIDRHTAPPSAVWEARATPKEPQTHD